jgi:hypothetical protein
MGWFLGDPALERVEWPLREKPQLEITKGAFPPPYWFIPE